MLTTHGTGAATRPCLVWALAEGWRAISTATVGGGIGDTRWVIDAEVPADYGRVDPDRHLVEIAIQLGLNGPGVGLLTAAPVAEWVSGRDDGVVVDGTIGVTRPTWAAAADDSGDHRWPDTINLVARVGVALSEAALVNAVATVTEAKTQALLERGVPGTGTASDAVCVACPVAGRAEPFAGPRSAVGARLARASHGVVLAGLSAL